MQEKIASPIKRIGILLMALPMLVFMFFGVYWKIKEVAHYSDNMSDLFSISLFVFVLGLILFSGLLEHSFIWIKNLALGLFWILKLLGHIYTWIATGGWKGNIIGDIRTLFTSFYKSNNLKYLVILAISFFLIDNLKINAVKIYNNEEILTEADLEGAVKLEAIEIKDFDFKGATKKYPENELVKYEGWRVFSIPKGLPTDVKRLIIEKKIDDDTHFLERPDWQNRLAYATGSALIPALLIIVIALIARYIFMRCPINKQSASWIAIKSSIFFYWFFVYGLAIKGEKSINVWILWLIMFFLARWIMTQDTKTKNQEIKK